MAHFSATVVKRSRGDSTVYRPVAGPGRRRRLWAAHSPEMLGVPKHGFINIHPSLLPRYRGPSPVPSAILDGVEETGVSLMLLDQGLDTGPVLAQQATKILPGEKADALTLRLFQTGARLLAESAPLWIDGHIIPKPQDPSSGHLYLQANAGRRAGGLAGECSNAVP